MLSQSAASLKPAGRSPGAGVERPGSTAPPAAASGMVATLVKSVWESSRRRKKKTSQTEMVSVQTAAAELGMNESQIKELVKRGVLKAHRVCKWAPLIIEKATLRSPRIERIKANPKKTQPNLI